jgi:hypothetical protein
MVLPRISYIGSLGGLRRRVGRGLGGGIWLRLGFGVRLGLGLWLRFGFGFRLGLDFRFRFRPGFGFRLWLGVAYRRLRGRDTFPSLGDSGGDNAPGILRVFDEACHEEVAE